MLTIALSKGRILEETLPLLAKAGIEPLEDPGSTRKLILATNHDDVRLLTVRATDVPPYVAWGGADMGIAGRDVLVEYEAETQTNALYEPVDLNIAGCKLMVAGKPGAMDKPGKLRIATKYVHTARQYFAAQGRQVELIKLYGSMELAPLVGMADVIVDLVDTGRTLAANGLVELEHIDDISSRMIVNKASMKTKAAQVKPLLQTLRDLTADLAAEA